MVNITYGLLSAPETPLAGGAGTAYSIATGGTDLIATLPDGTVVAYSPGDISWVLTCTALVVRSSLIMIPGLGYLYAGLVRRKNALTLMLLTIAVLATVSFQWFFWGYSLTFSDTGGSFIGDMAHIGFKGVLEEPVAGANNKVPRIVYAIYQNMFACLVPAIAIGAAAERGRIGPALIFTFCWATIVYDPIARWVWHPNGWAFSLGVLDYAGGGPVEICSGFTGLAYSIYLGKRRGWGTERLAFKPHNVSYVILGTVLLWFGWLGFNGGSTFAANLKAALAIVNTNLAASVAGFTWMFMDYRLERKWSAVGFCTGAIAGLVAITPAAGYVGAPASVFIGIVSAFFANVMTSLKGYFLFDDAMDIYAVHGVAGIVGTIFTGVFAQTSVTANDGYSEIPGGWMDKVWIQMGYQFAWVCATAGWTFVMTYLLMFIIDHIPYCHFRASEEEQIIGMDEAEAGEWAYDYAHLNRDLEGNYGEHVLQELRGEEKPEGNSNDGTLNPEAKDPQKALESKVQNKVVDAHEAAPQR